VNLRHAVICAPVLGFRLVQFYARQIPIGKHAELHETVALKQSSDQSIHRQALVLRSVRLAQLLFGVSLIRHICVTAKPTRHLS